MNARQEVQESAYLEDGNIWRIACSPEDSRFEWIEIPHNLRTSESEVTERERGNTPSHEQAGEGVSKGQMGQYHREGLDLA